MTTTTSTRWTEKLVLVALTLALGVGSLELVSGGMRSPAPETLAEFAETVMTQLPDTSKGHIS